MYRHCDQSNWLISSSLTCSITSIFALLNLVLTPVRFTFMYLICNRYFVKRTYKDEQPENLNKFIEQIPEDIKIRTFAEFLKYTFKVLFMLKPYECIKAWSYDLGNFCSEKEKDYKEKNLIILKEGLAKIPD